MVVLHYTTVLHFITLHYTSLNCIPLYYAALRCITLHSDSPRSVMMMNASKKLKVQKCPRSPEMSPEVTRMCVRN